MFNKTKRPLAVIGSVIIAIALIFGTIASIASITDTAFAASPVTVSATFPKEVLYGGTFSVEMTSGVSVTVRQPDGTYLTDSGVSNTITALTADKEVTANQVGNYVVTYYAGDPATNEYSQFTYNIYCYMEYEYMLVVEDDGAALPSVWKKGSEAPVLPTATLYYFDEDEERYFPTGLKDDPMGKNKIQCEVRCESGVKTYTAAELASGKKLYDVAENGTYFVTYTANILGGDNVVSAQYNVQVQESFNDDKAPSIAISGISSSSSINVANNLPVATTSDNYDERVKATITVQHAYSGSTLEDVPEVVVDTDTGFAKKDASGKILFYKKASNGGYAFSAGEYETTTNRAEAKIAKFDNNNFMTFYPTEEGVYKVTYVVEDDCGLKSVEHSYSVTVSDTTGPVFDKFPEEAIPSKWGENVKRLDLDANGELVSHNSVNLTDDETKIKFPVPEIYDNASAAGDISCSFTVTDPMSRQIIYVANILETSSNTNSKVVVTANGAPSDWYFANEATPGAKNIASGVHLKDFMYDTDYLGTYTIKYVAKDSKGNTASKTNSLTFSTDFSDTLKPSVSIDIPDYFAFRPYETVETIKDVSATDNNSASLDVQYEVIIGADTYELDYKAGSNEFRLQYKDGAKHIEFFDKDAKKQSFDIDDSVSEIQVILKATDDVGNWSSIGERVIKLISTETWNVTPVVNTIEAFVDDYYYFGSFSIDYEDVDYRNFTGFELFVQQVADSNGAPVDKKPLTNVEFDMYSDNGTQGDNTLNVENIRFKVSASGTYLVAIKGFNVSGASSLYMKEVEIEVSGGSGYGKVSADISAKVEVGTTYDLNDSYYGPAGATVLRHIKGGRLSIMGTEFTALQDCGYTFEDYVVTYPNISGLLDQIKNNVKNKDKAEAEAGAYSTAATASESPEFKVIGIMPTYVEKNTTVVLPAITASTKTANASRIVCKVTDKNGNSVSIKDTETDPSLKPNQISFYASKDGEYTVTYTATVQDKENTVSYKISCGDITPPEFTAEIGSINGILKLAANGSPDATVGQTFNYAKIVYTEDDTLGYTCSKTLISPEGEEVFESKVTTTDSANNGSAYELSIAGTYTVVYTVTDAVGNTTTTKYYINVTNSSSNVSSEAIQTLTIVLIIVGVIIIAGVIIYLVRFRTRKSR